MESLKQLCLWPCEKAMCSFMSFHEPGVQNRRTFLIADILSVPIFTFSMSSASPAEVSFAGRPRRLFFAWGQCNGLHTHTHIYIYIYLYTLYIILYYIILYYIILYYIIYVVWHTILPKQREYTIIDTVRKIQPWHWWICSWHPCLRQLWMVSIEKSLKRFHQLLTSSCPIGKAKEVFHIASALSCDDLFCC